MLPCGSQSIRSTRSPPAAAMAPTLQVMLVLPTPPLPFAIATTRGDVMFLTVGRALLYVRVRHTVHARLLGALCTALCALCRAALSAMYRTTDCTLWRACLHVCLHGVGRARLRWSAE